MVFCGPQKINQSARWHVSEWVFFCKLWVGVAHLNDTLIRVEIRDTTLEIQIHCAKWYDTMSSHKCLANTYYFILTCDQETPDPLESMKKIKSLKSVPGLTSVPHQFYLKNLHRCKIVKLPVFSFFTSNFKRTYLLNDKLLEKTDFTIIFKI